MCLLIISVVLVLKIIFRSFSTRTLSTFSRSFFVVRAGVGMWTFGSLPVLTRQLPVVTPLLVPIPPKCDNQKCLQTKSNIPWEHDCPTLSTSHLEENSLPFLLSSSIYPWIYGCMCSWKKLEIFKTARLMEKIGWGRLLNRYVSILQQVLTHCRQ